MKMIKFITKYNLRGSLLEKVSVNENTVILTLDYCYWQQDDYKDGTKETGIVDIVFDHVNNFIHEDYQINSDEIIDVFIDENDQLNIKVFNDINLKYYNCIIDCDRVEFTEIS